MLHYIKGVITETLPGMVCIENGGIGYEVKIPGENARSFGESGEVVTLYTALLVREDDISLYGFPDRESLALFRLLNTVPGVGPKVALAILSVLPAPELKRAILFGDTAALAKANGVGKKSAQRIVMELKDKIGAGEDFPEDLPASEGALRGDPKGEAVAALLALGFTRAEALSSLAGVSGEGLTSEDYIKLALRQRR